MPRITVEIQRIISIAMITEYTVWPAVVKESDSEVAPTEVQRVSVTLHSLLILSATPWTTTSAGSVLSNHCCNMAINSILVVDWVPIILPVKVTVPELVPQESSHMKYSL